MIISPISIATVGVIVLFIFATYLHAFRALLGGESRYDREARAETVWSGIVALLLGTLALGYVVWRIVVGLASVS